MDVVRTTQRWNLERAPFQFLYTVILLQDDAGDYFICHSQERKPQLDREQIMTLSPLKIPTAHISPSLPRQITLCLQPEDPSIYIKKPRLTAYDGTSSLADLLILEVRICELFRQHPHPHIVEYLGCSVKNNLITGICFRRYAETLQERRDRGGIINAQQTLDQVEAAIQHLNSKELKHNDIKPANIMFRTLDDHHAVLVDFDSSSHIAAALPPKRGMPDDEAIIELKAFLFQYANSQ